MSKIKNIDDFLRGHKIGIEEGKREALIELQKQNPNKDLPSNDVLYKIFQLLFECREKDRNSAYMNQYERWANYITLHWND